MKPFLLRHAVIVPACTLLASVSGKQSMASHPAQVMLLAIALQESAAEHRWQLGAGGKPLTNLARGWWQFEKNGGLAGVMRHRSTGQFAESLMAEIDLTASVDAAWEALPYSELLQASMARLLLWTDARPMPLPMAENEEVAWDIYRDNWRPGKPHRERWTACWKQARDVCGDF